MEDKIALLEACVRCGLHAKYSDVVHPGPRGPPVELLPVEKGYACAVDPASCAFACRSVEWMEKHVRDHPQHDAHLTNCYRSNVPLQTLFSPIGKKYFEVEPALKGIPSDDIFTKIVQEFLPSIPAPPITPSEPNERDALLRLTQWDVFMEPYYSDPSKRAAIMALKSAPAQNDIPFRRLHCAVLDYVKLGIEYGRKVSPNLTVRKHLVQGRTLSTVPL